MNRKSAATHQPSRTSRRRLLKGAAALAAGSNLVARLANAGDAPATTTRAVEAARTPDEPFGYCLNTSTIMGQNIGIVKQLEVAAKAGYSAVEPWLRDLDAYVAGGGTLKDLGKRIVDLGLVIPSSIGFAPWIVADDAERAKGLEQMKKDMDTVAQIGGVCIAAPPTGAQNPKDPDVSLAQAAERYRAICELGDKTGISPEAEVWGFSKTLTTVADAAWVAITSGHRRACVLPDVYHLYKGGSDPNGLRLLSGLAVHVIHLNDYPANPPREKITDASRIFPGEGIAPLPEILRNMHDAGFRGYLSLELFNRDYWKQSPAKAATNGLAKMRAVVRKTFAPA